MTDTMERSRGIRPRIGVFGIGLAAYWPQFAGLKEQLEGYQRTVEERVGQWAEVVSAGLVDSAPGAVEAGNLFQRRQVDMVYCYVGTYSTSSQVLPAVQIPRVPVLVLNLQPSAALDYERTDTKDWLANCCACCVPEIRLRGPAWRLVPVARPRLTRGRTLQLWRGRCSTASRGPSSPGRRGTRRRCSDPTS